MALKGVIQGPGGTGGGQLSGSGVTSVALSGPAPFITGPPVTSSGTLTFDFSGVPIPVADGGTGMGSFAPNSLIAAGLGSSSPFQSKPFPGTSSTFLDGTGAFSIPAGGGGGGTGTVTSVDLSLSSEFRISGNPITGAGVLVAGFIQPLNVGHGGTGLGSFGIGAIIRGGLSSTAPLQGTPLTNLSSTFLDGTGNFSTPPTTPTGGTGTVTSVDFAAPPGFTISGNPITGAGTLNLARIAPDSVAFGGTGMGSFGPGLILGGLTSTGPLRGLPFTNLTSNFLAGDGTFRIPVNPGGTVQSVALAMTSEFSVQGSPILGSGTFTVGFTQPLAIAHGGTGLGSIGIGAILRGGLSSTAPLQGTPLTNLTSTFLDGTGNFSTPPSGGTGGSGTVTSVALQLSSEFNVTGSPITNSGTLMASWAFQGANRILAGPTGAPSATPAFRNLVNADIPQSLSGKTLTSSTFQNPTIGAQTLIFGSTIKWNLNSGPIALLGMDSTAVGMMDTPANLPNAGAGVLRIMQLGTGLPNLLFNASWRFEGGVKPTLSSGFSNVDIITLYLESTAAYGVARKKFS